MRYSIGCFSTFLGNFFRRMYDYRKGIGSIWDEIRRQIGRIVDMAGRLWDAPLAPHVVFGKPLEGFGD